MRVASRVAKRLKTQVLRKLGNVRKISNMGGHIAQCLVSLQEPRPCEQQSKNTQKQIPNFSVPVQFYWITPFCSKYLVRNCRWSKLLNVAGCFTACIGAHSPLLSWITRTGLDFSLALFQGLPGTCGTAPNILAVSVIVSYKTRQVLECYHIASTPN